MVKENCIVKNKRYELVPPDGGWGYMICVAAIINLIAMSMFVVSFGMIYKDFILELEMGSTDVMLLSGVNMMCIAFAGYFTSAMMRLLSIRMLALLASFLFNVGIFGSIFIKTEVLFFFCQGVQYTGTGILYNLTCTQIKNYFLKKRLLAFSICQTLTAVASLAGPAIVKWCLESFGYRGTLVMVSAVSLQTFVAVALMQPVLRHMVKVEVETTTEEMKLLISEKSAQDLPVTTPVITLTDTDKSFDSKMDIENDNLQRRDKSKDSKNIFNEIVDVQLLKKFLLSNASMGPTFCMFADLTFSMMLPQALYAKGWNKEDVALAMTLSSFGDLITRASFIILNKWLTKIGSQEVYLVGIFIACTSRLCMLWSDNTTLIKIFITCIGIGRCAISILPSVIFAETFSPDKFTSVLGIFMMMLGIMNLVLGPAIGAVRDLTDSYSTAFYVITSCYAVVLLLWSIELLYKKNKHRRAIQRAAAEKMKKLNAKSKAK